MRSYYKTGDDSGRPLLDSTLVVYRRSIGYNFLRFHRSQGYVMPVVFMASCFAAVQVVLCRCQGSGHVGRPV
jgi:hypothetical protein